MTIRQVSELTPSHIGKLMRVQTENGAYIEGTLASIHSKVTEPFGSVVQVHVTFEELLSPMGRVHLPFLTYGNRNAREIDEEEQYNAG